MTEAINWIEANEPDTLEFSLYEQPTPATTENGSVKLLAGPPVVAKGGFSHAFRR